MVARRPRRIGLHLDQIDHETIEAAVGMEPHHAFAEVVEHVEATLGIERDSLHVAALLQQVGRHRQFLAIEVESAQRRVVVAIADEHRSGPVRHHHRPTAGAGRQPELAQERAIGSKALDGGPHRVRDQQDVGVGPQSARRPELCIAVAAARQRPQHLPAAREALHTTPPRLLAAGDQHDVTGQGNRVRPIEHAGPIAPGVPRYRRRVAEVAEVASERIAVADAVVLGVGDEDVVVLIDGDAGGIAVASFPGRQRPRRHPLLRQQIEQEHMPERTGPRHGQHVAAHCEARRHRWMLTTRGAVVAAAFAVLTACSALPEASLPPFADHRVDAEYIVPASGRLRVPSSGSELLVHELAWSPTPLREVVVDGTDRYFLFEPGQMVTLRTRLRVFGVAGQAPRTITEILADSHAVHAVR